jgi:hypothetical protein
MCTCGSEIKCPHDISSQLDSASEELEAVCTLSPPSP